LETIRLRLVYRLLSKMNTIAMKQPNTSINDGQNWQWPDKTWFRQRLNAIKAEENQQRRRPMVNSNQPAEVTSAKTAAADPLKAE
jgi:hypothetical protein